MGWLDNFLNKPLFKKTRPDFPPAAWKEPKSELELLERHIGLSFEKQIDFGDYIGQCGWDIDLEAGTIAFGDRLLANIQIIGRFAYANNSWLWAWAAEQVIIPPSLLVDVMAIRSFGEQYEIRRFQQSTYPIQIDELHNFGMIAVGMFGADAYFMGDYGQGVGLFTVKNEALRNHRKDSTDRIFTTFPQIAANFNVDHRQALRCYLMDKGYILDEQKTKVIGSKGKEKCLATFDKHGRLLTLKS